ncbi:30S ribosomal protein S19e [Candidatus Woesearchaeota archaeon]|nr:30S ribosomal protein S19e [Candidatus Woesearchaeota archaeon]
MASIYDVDANMLIEKAAQQLGKMPELKAPEWATFTKTGVHKERPPQRADWWQVRAAAVLRAVCIKGPIGVQKLRTKYGGKANDGHQPEHHYKGSGNVLRKVLQQLEKAGLVKQDNKDGRKGRIVTPKGKSFLDKIATQIQGPKAKKVETPKAEPAKQETEDTKKEAQKEEKQEAKETKKEGIQKAEPAKQESKKESKEQSPVKEEKKEVKEQKPEIKAEAQ